MKKILVTGANGQLGKKIKDYENEFPEFQFLYTDVNELDITNLTEIENFLKNHRPNLVINCAAYTAVDNAETDIEKANLLNAKAPEFLAQACNNYNAKLYHISTDYVFGATLHNTPFKEDDTVAPQSVYGKTKYEGEKNIAKYKNVRIFRTSLLYSEYGNNFVKSIIKLGQKHDELNVIFDQISSPTYAGDLAKALLMVAQQDDNQDYNCDILNYTNEGTCSRYDLTMQIFKIKNIPTKVNPIRTKEFPTPAERPAFSVLDKTKIKQNFKINIPYYLDSLEYCLTKIN